jgi:predicted O-methyltransferase YrrM
MSNKITLTILAKKAILSGPMVAAYPDPENDKVTFPPSPYYRFLKLLADEMGASLSVELGLCGGGGSLHLAMASNVVIGVDVALDYEDNIRWIKREYPNFHFLHGDSVQSASMIFTAFGPIDILFIDTTHTYEQTMGEYFAYLPYLSDKAVICLDDLFRPGMDRAWNEMPENKARFDFLHPSASPTDGGFGVIWKS